MKKLILISLIALFSTVLSDQSFAQIIKEENHYTVNVATTSNPVSTTVRCHFVVYKADGTLKGTEVVAVPSSTNMVFQSNISFAASDYWYYWVYGVENTTNYNKWWLYYTQSTYLSGVGNWDVYKTLFWNYGIPPNIIQ